MKKQTTDRSSPFYAPHAIGATRRITPEGYLLCEGVAIARVGTQVYGAHELPELEPDINGLIYIERSAEEVFDPESMASWNGKAITINHPDEFVTPDNWRALSTGSMQNPRRGQGTDSDLLLVDVLITDKSAVEYANRELPELSGGYEAEYEQTAPGRGRQRRIRGNHVAMLKSGRAGRRCAIKDEQSPFVPFSDEELSMKNKPLIARLLASFGVKDADAAAEVLAQASEASPPVATTDQAPVSRKEFNDLLKQTTDGFAALTELVQNGGKTKEQLEQEAAAAAATSAAATKKTLDAEMVREAISRAEILAPGMAMPTMDGLQAESAFNQFVTKVLETANAKQDSAEALKPFLSGREIKSLTVDAALAVFNGAAELVRAKNNSATSAVGTARNPFARTGNPFVASTKDGAPVTAADRVRAQQQSYQDFWSKQKAS